MEHRDFTADIERLLALMDERAKRWSNVIVLNDWLKGRTARLFPKTRRPSRGPPDPTHSEPIDED